MSMFYWIKTLAICLTLTSQCKGQCEESAVDFSRTYLEYDLCNTCQAGSSSQPIGMIEPDDGFFAQDTRPIRRVVLHKLRTLRRRLIDMSNVYENLLNDSSSLPDSDECIPIIIQRAPVDSLDILTSSKPCTLRLYDGLVDLYVFLTTTMAPIERILPTNAPTVAFINNRINDILCYLRLFIVSGNGNGNNDTANSLPADICQKQITANNSPRDVMISYEYARNQMDDIYRFSTTMQRVLRSAFREWV